jgi:hypothetical protein
MDDDCFTSGSSRKKRKRDRAVSYFANLLSPLPRCGQCTFCTGQADELFADISSVYGISRKMFLHHMSVVFDPRMARYGSKLNGHFAVPTIPDGLSIVSNRVMLVYLGREADVFQGVTSCGNGHSIDVILFRNRYYVSTMPSLAVFNDYVIQHGSTTMVPRFHDLMSQIVGVEPF